LPRTEKEFELKGVVRWTTAEASTRSKFKGGGIMFTDMSVEDREVISSFVEEEAKRLGLNDTAPVNINNMWPADCSVDR